MKIYQNYHRHSDMSNLYGADSSVKYEDYAKRAIELNHNILSTGEHGLQGNYFQAFKIAKKYNLKFIYSVEAYWVKNRFEKDATNSHMIIIAKTNKGRKAINLVLSEANKTGYYYKPRLDLDLIMSLPENDVFITSACVAFWKYENIEEIILKLYNKFKDNFMLEIQYQPMSLQLEVNKKILNLHNKYGINIIAGMDSHYIYPDQKKEREEVLLSKGIKYDNEGEFYMDYPDYKTAFKRFQNQNIFNNTEIELALENTNLLLNFENLDNIDIFSNRIKLPTLYPNLSQGEKNNKLKQIILSQWNKRKNKIPKKKYGLYKTQIKKELKIVFDTNMTDYFLLDYEIINKGIELGGIITDSGRGSAVSFYINNLLNFTKIDRISAKVKMFPERFMSKSRILETKSLPDIDFNLGNPEVFAEAQNIIFGEKHSYPMIAYGTFKKKSAFKMYAKAKDLDFKIANIVSSQIGEYEKDLSYLEDDEKDTISVLDYIDKKYLNLYEESIIYQGIISDKKAHPCGYLIYNKNIEEEIGLIKVKTESTKKETLVCLMDGKAAEDFNFLKNDLLKVDVAKTNYIMAKKADIKSMSQDELISLTNNNKKVWNIYANGYTMGINQVEKPNTVKKVMKYKPKNIEQLCAFIAGIRPSFQSMYKIFENREHFSYNIPSFDKIIRNSGVDESFILYQETIMAVLSFAGFPDDKNYSILKSISKKRESVFKEIKPKFIKNISKKFIEYDKITKDEAKEKSEKVWKIIDDSSAYGFNASHSFCMSYDSLRGAYMKAEYPLIFFETQLQEYNEKKNKDKIALFKQELKYFNITLDKIKFRNKNIKFEINGENSISQPISSIKYINADIAQELYTLSQQNNYTDFLSLLIDMKSKTLLRTNQLDILIRLDYFTEFGKSKKLLTIVKYYDKIYGKKVVSKANISDFFTTEDIIAKYTANETPKQYRELDYEGLLQYLIKDIEDKDISMKEKINTEIEYLGYIKYTNPNISEKFYYVQEVKVYNNSIKPYLKLYCIHNGEIENYKITEDFEKNIFEEGDVIKILEIYKKPKMKKNDNKWQKIGGFNNHIKRWDVI